MKNIKTIIILIFLILLSSCATKVDKKIDSAYVMVYDYDNCGVMDALFFMDGKELGKTDIYGRFMFNATKGKIHTFLIRKDGYEEIEITTTVSPGQLLYFKIGTGSYYAKEAEYFLDCRDYSEAKRMINKALKIKERKDWLFLKEIIEREEI